MRLSALAILFVTFTTVCGSPIIVTNGPGSSTLAERFIHEPEELIPRPNVPLRPQNMDLKMLAETANALRAHNRYQDIICDERFPKKLLVAGEDDEVYLIEVNNPFLVRRIVVRDSRDSNFERYEEKLLRIYRKIFIHNRLGNLITWLKVNNDRNMVNRDPNTVNRGPNMYYIAISYAEATVPVSRQDVHDPIVSINEMRWKYGEWCLEREIDLGSVNGQDFIYLRHFDERNYEPLYV